MVEISRRRESPDALDPSSTLRAQAYALRAKLEVEERSRFRPLTEGLTMAHYNTVAEQVFNRAETNALECGEWLEKAADLSRWRDSSGRPHSLHLARASPTTLTIPATARLVKGA